jgi:hypothetical protein
MKLEHDTLTNTTIERDETEAELAQIKLDKIEQAKIDKAEAAKHAAREALLSRLGITADEAALLLG